MRLSGIRSLRSTRSPRNRGLRLEHLPPPGVDNILICINGPALETGRIKACII